MPGLIAEAAAHGTIETRPGDAGYNCAGVIETTATEGIELLAPEGRTRPGETDTTKRSDDKLLKGQFTYVTVSDTYRCPAGHSLTRLGPTPPAQPATPSGSPGQADGATLYGGAPCTDCPLRAKCTTAKVGRQIKRYAADAAKEAMRAKLADAVQRRRYNQRAGMVEPVFANLKVNQGLRRFRRRGLVKVRLEFKVHLAAHNLSRAVAHAARRACLIIACPAAFRAIAALRHAIAVARKPKAPRRSDGATLADPTPENQSGRLLRRAPQRGRGGRPNQFQVQRSQC